MKDFKKVVKLRRIPAKFLFHCTLCDFEWNAEDWHLGLIEMNKHVMLKHSDDVQSLDMEELYSRKPRIRLDSF